MWGSSRLVPARDHRSEPITSFRRTTWGLEGAVCRPSDAFVPGNLSVSRPACVSQSAARKRSSDCFLGGLDGERRGYEITRDTNSSARIPGIVVYIAVVPL